MSWDDEGGDWPESDEKTFEGECCNCHVTRPVQMLPDPYIVALWPEDNPEPEAWCWPCYENRADEV